MIVNAIASVLSKMVREDLDAELKGEYGATQDATMAVRDWLKSKGLWEGPDYIGGPEVSPPQEPNSVIMATFTCVDTVYTKPIRRKENGTWETLDGRQMFAEDDCISHWEPYTGGPAA